MGRGEVRAGAARFAHVDVLRAVAATSILAYHGLTAAGGSGSALVDRFASHLDLGVPVFFVISGFVLYRPLVAARAAGRAPLPWGAHMVRRVLRIVPAFWVALVVAAVVLGLHDVLAPEGARYFLFAQAYLPGGSGGLAQAWTLDTELVFYAVVPVVAVALAGRERRGLAWLLAAGAASAVATVALVDQSAGRHLSFFYTMPFWADHFAVGMALAYASVHAAVPERRARRALWWPAAAALFAFAALIGGPLGTPRSDAQLLALHAAGAAMAACLIVPAVFGAPRPAARPLVFGGLVSYGIYLYHPLGYRIAAWLGVPATGLRPGVMLVLAITVLLAWLSWRLIEAPAITLGRRLTSGQDHVVRALGAAQAAGVGAAGGGAQLDRHPA